jgi:hypothetical protein
VLQWKLPAGEPCTPDWAARRAPRVMVFQGSEPPKKPLNGGFRSPGRWVRSLHRPGSVDRIDWTSMAGYGQDGEGQQLGAGFMALAVESRNCGLSSLRGVSVKRRGLQSGVALKVRARPAPGFPSRTTRSFTPMAH